MKNDPKLHVKTCKSRGAVAAGVTLFFGSRTNNWSGGVAMAVTVGKLLEEVLDGSMSREIARERMDT